MKGVEKEYISILGIFASIVLAFVLINIIYILVKFIFTINDKDAKLFKIEKLNWTCLIIAIVVIGSWLFSIKELQEFISDLLPWGK